MRNARLLKEMIEQLSNQQGTGEITLFFPIDQVELKQGSLQYTRLITFLDYLAHESRGRQVLFLLIGSASTIGNL